jgi:hypothetical protein
VAAGRRIQTGMRSELRTKGSLARLRVRSLRQQAAERVSKNQ